MNVNEEEMQQVSTVFCKDFSINLVIPPLSCPKLPANESRITLHLYFVTLNEATFILHSQIQAQQAWTNRYDSQTERVKV